MKNTKCRKPAVVAIFALLAILILALLLGPWLYARHVEAEYSSVSAISVLNENHRKNGRAWYIYNYGKNPPDLWAQDYTPGMDIFHHWIGIDGPSHCIRAIFVSCSSMTIHYKGDMSKPSHFEWETSVDGL